MNFTHRGRASGPRLFDVRQDQSQGLLVRWRREPHTGRERSTGEGSGEEHRPPRATRTCARPLRPRARSRSGEGGLTRSALVSWLWVRRRACRRRTAPCPASRWRTLGNRARRGHGRSRRTRTCASRWPARSRASAARTLSLRGSKSSGRSDRPAPASAASGRGRRTDRRTDGGRRSSRRRRSSRSRNGSSGRPADQREVGRPASRQLVDAAVEHRPRCVDPDHEALLADRLGELAREVARSARDVENQCRQVRGRVAGGRCGPPPPSGPGEPLRRRAQGPGASSARRSRDEPRRHQVLRRAGRLGGPLRAGRGSRRSSLRGGRPRGRPSGQSRALRAPVRA